MKKLDEREIQKRLITLPGWSLEGMGIVRTFHFKDYYETAAFVNAVVWIAHSEDHHPQITFGYKQCTVCYSTHAVKGISGKDFACAEKIDRLLVKST